jgi:SRSO17 transposase
MVGDGTPDRTQRFLYQVNEDAQAARARLRQFVLETFGGDEAVGVGDETSFLKMGEHSVGGQRQFCGAASTIENCQVVTVLSYARKSGHVFLDRRLSPTTNAAVHLYVCDGSSKPSPAAPYTARQHNASR